MVALSVKEQIIQQLDKFTAEQQQLMPPKGCISVSGRICFCRGEACLAQKG